MGKKETFLMAMLDDPAAVQELVAITEHLLTAFWTNGSALWHGLYRALSRLLYGGGFTFSEDEVGRLAHRCSTSSA